MATISQQLTSTEALDALEAALRALTGGGVAVDNAVAAAITARPPVV